jgi:hypothetical protein
MLVKIVDETIALEFEQQIDLCHHWAVSKKFSQTNLITERDLYLTVVQV